MSEDSKDAEVIWELLRKHVPEVTSGVIKVLGIAREPGVRSVLAVASRDPRCDPVGTCVGLRGERVKRIVSELGDRERIDVVRWDESAKRLITGLLCPLRVIRIAFDDATREARATVLAPSILPTPDLALRTKLLMSLTGWRLLVELKQKD